MPEPGQIDECEFGPYRLIRRVGEGAMGEVLQAVDPKTGSEIAIKRPWTKLEADPKAIRRFEREAKAASSVNHPNICRVLDFGRIDNRHYIAMELIDGMDLARWVQEQPQLDPVRAANLVRKVALGLQAIHATGVVHRDLKPANIMIKPNEEPVVTDFGMANLMDTAIGVSRLTPAGAMVGTPAYMSPEQILAEHEKYCPASDLYSLGIIFYELLCGWPPFSGSLATILGTIVSEPPPEIQVHVPELDANLNRLVQKALNKEPEDRYQSGQEFANAIDDWLTNAGPISAPAPEPSAGTEPSTEPVSRKLSRMLKSLFK